ncbi:hypothetical protein TD95_000481 [Thielaviopsis punctulata]|uniref:DH domain-containing protein n=1 Tax=Thielaviopsis punctulata TaxID=72032 RepID=A0A0F4ZA22_9PEZI|nr:hypothetical protein TD95_000481 [Thielaviopsis punctulata]
MASYALYSDRAQAVSSLHLRDYQSEDDSSIESDDDTRRVSTQDQNQHRHQSQSQTGHPRSNTDTGVDLSRSGHQNDSQTQNHPRSRSQDDAPFHKWIKTLQRRAQKRPRPIGENANVPSQLMDMADRATLSHQRMRRFSSADSSTSSAFVSGVKSASISVASTRRSFSRSRHFGRSHTGSRTDRSSRASHVGNRLSVSDDDGYFPSSPTTAPLDPAALNRAMQRRRLLNELIKTEEGYISDVRFLMNAYITILAALPTLPDGLRASINHNLAAIVELHEEILAELLRVVPGSQYGQIDYYDAVDHQKSSVDYSSLYYNVSPIPEHGSMRTHWSQQVPDVFAEAQVTEDVAKVFTKKEYGAKYEMMIKDVTAAHRTMPDWDMYQKGLETLALSLGPSNNCENASRKALTIGDLLVKYTPNEDCPNSHMAIEEALVRMREATAEINRATTDAKMKITLERTWILQDRLVFSNQRLDAVSKNRIRSFGHIKLCGVLHACWQTKDSANGQYMICLLYNDVLCLASASKADQIYSIKACISLCNLRVEEVDNGRGIQCHTAPFSWKLVFEHDHHLFEIILTACSPKEELEWKSRLLSADGIGFDRLETPIIDQGFLSLDIKSLGTVFGKPGTVTHRMSIHRASTIGPKSQMCQVILKNTCVLKEAKTPSNGSINRSQSLLATSSRIAVLSPSRAERARLEAMLSDIWSKEVLPFPGMTARARSEHMVRATTSSMIRRLSVASIASTFSKRTNSLASITKHSSSTGTGTGTGTNSTCHGTATPGTPPIPFDDPVTLIHNMTRRSTDVTPSCFPGDDLTVRPLSQLTIMEDDGDRRPLRRMTLPVSPPRFSIRDLWASGETATKDSPPDMEYSPTDVADDEVLEMRVAVRGHNKRCTSSGSVRAPGKLSLSNVNTVSVADEEGVENPCASRRKALDNALSQEDRVQLSIDALANEVTAAAVDGDVDEDEGEKDAAMDGEEGKKGTMSRRMTKRWNVSNGRHRDSMVHGIRNLFR